MYRIVKLYPGERLRYGPVHRDREHSNTFLAHYCLSPESSYYKSPDRFKSEYRYPDVFDGMPVKRADGAELEEDPDCAEMYVVTEVCWQVVWDPAPEENEFGRVSP